MTTLREALQTVYDRHGKLTPELVVEAARPQDHPLHSRFEWNDQVAGEAWRRHQAAELIRSVKIVYREPTETEPARTVRAFHAVRGPQGHVYEPADRVAEDPFLRQLLLRDMQREWKALHRRYAQFQEFADLVRADLDQDRAA